MRSRRSLRVVLALGALVIALGASAPVHTGSAAASPRTLKVPADYATITAAVAAAHPGDFVLVGPGTYHEAVIVTTPGITIAGVDRNTVILDGQHRLQNAVKVEAANGVVVENLTGRNYQSNSFWWDNVTGWRGSFLTAENNVEYGIYAYNSTVGMFDHDYASGNGDSGFYIGSCYHCKAVIDHVQAENNNLGYSGTNAGGVLIENSEWDHNLAGIIPNTLTSEEAYPQGGQEGNVITGNYIHDNNNAHVPDTFFIGPLTSILGMGIEIAGGWNNLVIGNTIRNQKHYGITLHYLITPTQGNKIQFNDIQGSGDSDLAWDGVGANNCFEGNKDAATVASSDPPMIEQTNSCALGGLPVGGDPATGIKVALNGAGITEPRPANPSVYQNQAFPSEQQSMADPCIGAPVGCEANRQVLAAAAPVTVANPAPEIVQAPAVPASLPQIAAGLQAKPSADEVAQSVAAALQHLQIQSQPAVVHVPAAPGSDISGYLAVALATMAAGLVVAAAIGVVVRRPRRHGG